MKEFLDENKSSIKISIVMIIFAIIVIIIQKFFTPILTENELKNKIKDAGEEYYETYYESFTPDGSTLFLEQIKDDGMEINLKDLVLNVYDGKDPGYFFNKNTNKMCDYDDTYVTIYPVSPYGKNNYKIKINLECGF